MNLEHPYVSTFKKYSSTQFARIILLLALTPCAWLEAATGAAVQTPARTSAPQSLQSLQGITLKTPALEEYDIGRAIVRRRVVLFLLPGIWDPVSVHILKTLRISEADLTALDFQIIAVSSSRVGVLTPFVRSENLPYVILADPESLVAQRLNRRRIVSPERRERLAAAPINWAAHHGKVPDYLPDAELLIVGADALAHRNWTTASGNPAPDATSLLSLARQTIAAESLARRTNPPQVYDGFGLVRNYE